MVDSASSFSISFCWTWSLACLTLYGLLKNPNARISNLACTWVRSVLFGSTWILKSRQLCYLSTGGPRPYGGRLSGGTLPTYDSTADFFQNADSTAKLTKCRLHGGCSVRKLPVIFTETNQTKNTVILAYMNIMNNITSLESGDASSGHRVLRGAIWAIFITCVVSHLRTAWQYWKNYSVILFTIFMLHVCLLYICMSCLNKFYRQLSY